MTRLEIRAFNDREAVARRSIPLYRSRPRGFLERRIAEFELCICANCCASSPARAAYAARRRAIIQRQVETYILPDPVPLRERVSR